MSKPTITAQFEHDCPNDVLIAVLPAADIYKQCGGRGYTLRHGNDGPDYASSVMWSLVDTITAYNDHITGQAV